MLAPEGGAVVHFCYQIHFNSEFYEYFLLNMFVTDLFRLPYFRDHSLKTLTVINFEFFSENCL